MNVKCEIFTQVFVPEYPSSDSDTYSPQISSLLPTLYPQMDSFTVFRLLEIASDLKPSTSNALIETLKTGASSTVRIKVDL